MQILDILNSSWMIDKGRLSQVSSVYAKHFAGPKIEFKDFKINRQPENFKIVKGTAIIPISGVLTPKMSFFDFFFGGTSFELITKSLNEALERSEVRNIILHMDTPGGTVQGSFELSKLIKESRDIKDIQTFSDGMIASAGMLIAGATSKITISSGTVEAGSIGVIAKRIDVSKMNEEFGVKVHEFVSGKFKNSFSPNKDLTEEDAQFIQSQVDFLFSMFANEIAENRSLKIEDIINMEAKTFIGQQAIDEGLVDQIGTLESLLNSGVSNFKTTIKGQKMTTENEKIPVEMTVDLFKANHQSIFSQVDDAAFKRGMIAGQKRTLDIQAASFLGQEDLLKLCLEDSSMSAGDAAIKFNQAEKKTTLEAGADINKELVDPVDTKENGTPGTKEEAKKDPAMEYEAAVVTAEDGGKVLRGKAMQIVKKVNPKLHAAYIEAINKK